MHKRVAHQTPKGVLSLKQKRVDAFVSEASDKSTNAWQQNRNEAAFISDLHTSLEVSIISERTLASEDVGA